jgi:photosystem II stability/assembly factor-like uncharacterized protein
MGETIGVSQPLDPAPVLEDVDFPPGSQTGFAVGSSIGERGKRSPTGVILNTTNGGRNWGRQPVADIPDLRAVHFPTGSQTGYAVGAFGDILKTTDSGAKGSHMDLQSNCRIP